MRHPLIRTFALAGIVAGLTLTAALDARSASAPVATTVQTAAAYPKTRAIVESYVATNKLPGVVVAIGRGDAPPTIIAAGATAFDAGAAKVDGDSLWRVYSMTKPVTAIAAMMLVEDGKIGLDQPISDFIPAFKDMKVLVDPDKDLTSRPATRPITVRMLMTHTAGLGYTITTKGPLLKEYDRLGIIPFTANAAVEAQVRKVRPATLEEFANRTATLPLIAEPGTKWSYSIGLDILGRVIEVASGMPFDAFVQTRLFDPLKMTSSYWQVPPEAAARLVSGYTWFGDKPIVLDAGASSVFLQKPSFPYGGAGLVMSAKDYDRFHRMLLNGGAVDGVRVMKPETVALALSNLLPPGVTYGETPAESGGSTAAQGFGAGASVALADQPDGSSRGSYGWGGAAGTMDWIDPAKKLRVTVMVNYIPPDRYPLRAEITRAIYADLAGK